MAETDSPMVDEPPTEALPDTPESAPRTAVIRFIAGFVVLVMAFLLGYRYSMNTSANIWYLFQVARHTAWALDLVGISGEVEPLHESNPEKWRADLAEWRAERAGGESVAASVPPGPITAFEAWQWKAWSRIREGETLSEEGPLVHFVLEEGVAARQRALGRESLRLKAEARDSGEDRSAEIAALEARVRGLAEELDRVPVGTERKRASSGRQFGFHVVPDCGALPSMSIFLAAVLAFPAAWWKRLAGSVVGLAVLYGVNIVRLATLGYIGAIDASPGRKWFTFAHEYVWQGVFIVFVVAVWMLWVELLVRPRRA